MRVVKNSRCPQAPSTLSEWTARRQSMSIVFSIAIGSLTLSSATINDSQVVSSRRELGRWATPGCDAWCSEYTCYDAADPNRNRECLLCPWCQGPPSPPAPPVNPGHCAYTYQPCFQQWPIIAPLCCVRETDGCYRRKGRLYAMCKPLPPYGTPCVDDDTWLCPGTWGASPPTPPTPPAAPSPPPPPPCAGHYQECTHSMCCLNGWPCLKKRGRWFAQCRNPREMQALYKYGVCRPTDQWDCPGWQHSPPPPPLPPAPPEAPTPSIPIWDCAEPYQACWGFGSPPPFPPPSPLPPVTIFGRRMEQDNNGSAAFEAHVAEASAAGVEVQRVQPPQPQQPWLVGDEVDEEERRRSLYFDKNTAAVTRCCNNDANGNTFGCYKHNGRFFALCRPTPNGQCNHADREAGWECPEFPPPASPSPPSPYVTPPSGTSTLHGYDHCVENYQNCWGGEEGAIMIHEVRAQTVPLSLSLSLSHSTHCNAPVSLTAAAVLCVCSLTAAAALRVLLHLLLLHRYNAASPKYSARSRLYNSDASRSRAVPLHCADRCLRMVEHTVKGRRWMIRGSSLDGSARRIHRRIHPRRLHHHTLHHPHVNVAYTKLPRV